MKKSLSPQFFFSISLKQTNWEFYCLRIPPESGYNN